MKKYLKPLGLGMALGLGIMLLIAASVPFTAFNTNQFNTNGNTVSIASGVLITNPAVSGTLSAGGTLVNSAGLTASSETIGTSAITTLNVNTAIVAAALTVPATVAGNPTLSGRWLWTNGLQTSYSKEKYQTNFALTGTINTTTLTGPAGAFTGWIPGVNLIDGSANQYIVEYVNSTTSITVYPTLAATYTGYTNWQYSSPAWEFRDYNANHTGGIFDPGGCLWLGDGGGGPPFISLVRAGADGSATHGMVIDIIGGVGVFGPQAFIIGGNGTGGVGATRSFLLNAEAPAYTFGMLPSGEISISGGFTNYLGTAIPIFVPLQLPKLTASRALVLDSGNNAISATGTADATHYLDGTGAYSVPAGSGGVTIAALAAISAPTNMGAATNFDCLSSFMGIRSTTNVSIAFQLTNEQAGLTYIIRLNNTGATPPPLVTISPSTGRANTYVGGQASYAPSTNASLKIVIECMTTTNLITFIDNYK